MYGTSNTLSGHMQEQLGHILTSIHTLAPRTCEFVHTGGVDTCIVYMYRLASRTLYKPSAAAVTALMHHTHPSCTPALAATATFARVQHENTQKQLPTHVDAGAWRVPLTHRTHCAGMVQTDSEPIRGNSLAIWATLGVLCITHWPGKHQDSAYKAQGARMPCV